MIPNTRVKFRWPDGKKETGYVVCEGAELFSPRPDEVVLRFWNGECKIKKKYITVKDEIAQAWKMLMAKKYWEEIASNYSQE